MLIDVIPKNVEDSVFREKEFLLRQNFQGVIEPEPLFLRPIIPALGDFFVSGRYELFVSPPGHNDGQYAKIRLLQPSNRFSKYDLYATGAQPIGRAPAFIIFVGLRKRSVVVPLHFRCQQRHPIQRHPKQQPKHIEIAVPAISGHDRALRPFFSLSP